MNFFKASKKKNEIEILIETLLTVFWPFSIKYKDTFIPIKLLKKQ